MILIKNLIFSIYYLFIWILIWNWKSIIPFFSLILIKKIDIFICLFKNDRYKDSIIYRYILYISRTINIQIVQCSDRDIYNKLSLDELFNFFHTKKKNRNQKIMWNNIIYLLYVITWRNWRNFNTWYRTKLVVQLTLLRGLLQSFYTLKLGKKNSRNRRETMTNMRKNFSWGNFYFPLVWIF